MKPGVFWPGVNIKLMCELKKGIFSFENIILNRFAAKLWREILPGIKIFFDDYFIF